MPAVVHVRHTAATHRIRHNFLKLKLTEVAIVENNEMFVVVGERAKRLPVSRTRNHRRQSDSKIPYCSVSDEHQSFL